MEDHRQALALEVYTLRDSARRRVAGNFVEEARRRDMKIGLTYDLRSEYLALGYGEEETAEFDQPDTVDGIEEALQELGTRPSASATPGS